jgi:3-dehydroquinate synthase
VRVPTTVLAQNDGGVGVKNGMNEHHSKNFVGTFAPPFAVINDFDYIANLPQKEWLGGIAEAFKVAIIKDARFFDFLCRHAVRLRARDLPAMEHLIERCAELHLHHIRSSGDAFEFGSARPLDFGHWSAHRMEIDSGYRLGHGQAVAIGIALDSYYAFRKRFLSAAELERIITGLLDAGLPIWDPVLGKRRGGRPLVLIGLEQFREHLGGELTVTMPAHIGRKIEVHSMDDRVIAAGIEFLRRRYQKESRSDADAK